MRGLVAMWSEEHRRPQSRSPSGQQFSDIGRREQPRQNNVDEIGQPGTAIQRNGPLRRNLKHLARSLCSMRMATDTGRTNNPAPCKTRAEDKTDHDMTPKRASHKLTPLARGAKTVTAPSASASTHERHRTVFEPTDWLTSMAMTKSLSILPDPCWILMASWAARSMKAAIWRNSVSFIPRVVRAGAPTRTPPGDMADRSPCGQESNHERRRVRQDKLRPKRSCQT